MSGADLQAAINAGGEVIVPPGTIQVGSTLLATGQRRLKLYFDAGAVLQWAGPPNVPLLDLAGCRDCTVEGLVISASSAAPLAEGVRFETLSGYTSTNNCLRDCWIDGTDGGVGIGVRWVPTAGDKNNDFTRLERVSLANYSGAALSVEHSQSVGHECSQCSASGDGYAQRGVQVLAGALSWQGGGLSGHQDVDFYLQNLGRPAVIRADAEGSNRFLVAYGPTAAPYRLHLDGCRVAADRLNPDGRLLILESPGPVLLDGCDLGGGWQQQGAVYPQLWVNPGKPLAGRMSGCTWSAHGACTQPSVHVGGGAGLGDFQLQGNLYADATGQAVAHVGPEVG